MGFKPSEMMKWKAGFMCFGCRLLYCIYVIFFSGDESSECDKHFLPNVAWITGKNEVALTTIEISLYWIALAVSSKILSTGV